MRGPFGEPLKPLPQRQALWSLRFISAFDKMIGELNELANYGLSKADVPLDGHPGHRQPRKGTLEELKERRCVKFPEHFLESDPRTEVEALDVSIQLISLYALLICLYLVPSSGYPPPKVWSLALAPGH